MADFFIFLSAPKPDNHGFREPRKRLAEAKDSVARKDYPAISTTRQKREESHNDSSRPRDPLVQKELTRAGYTLTETSDDSSH